MAVNVTGTFQPAGAFKVADLADLTPDNDTDCLVATGEVSGNLILEVAASHGSHLVGTAAEAISGKWAFSDYITFVEIAAPGGDPADTQSWLYTKADGAVQKLYFEQQDGTVTDLLAGGGGQDLATDTLWAAQGDLVKGTGDDGADILTIGADHTVLVSNGTDPSWSAAPPLANIADTGDTNRLTLGTSSPHLLVTGDTKFDDGSNDARFAMNTNIHGNYRFYIVDVPAVDPVTQDHSQLVIHTSGIPQLQKNLSTLSIFQSACFYDFNSYNISIVAGMVFQFDLHESVRESTSAVSVCTSLYLAPRLVSHAGGASPFPGPATPPSTSMTDCCTIHCVPWDVVDKDWIVTTHRGLHILGCSITASPGENDGGVVTHVGLDMENQATNADTDYSIRVLGTPASIHQPAMAIGANAAPAATLDITQAGASAAIPVLELDQDDTSEPFIDFVGTSTADANSSISSLNTSGATTDHIQIDLNGAKAWIAVSTNAPS